MNTTYKYIACSLIALATSDSLCSRIKVSTGSIATIDRSAPHEENGRFYNFPGEQPFREHIWSNFKTWLNKTMTRTPYAPADINTWKYYQNPLPRSEAPTIHWIGHSSFLIQINGLNILTDPVFYDLPLGSRRTTAAGISPERLPHIDIVLISHDHRDHLDDASIKQLRQFDPLILIPEGLKGWFKKRGFSNIVESSWWNQHTCTDAAKQITITFVPSMHWCQRKMFDTNQSLWGGWVIQANGATIYFAGDTAFAPKFFEDISQSFDHIDVALLPIGPCEPRSSLKDGYMDAHQACEAFVKLNATCMIPMHWGTFQMGTDSFDAPLTAMMHWWEQHPESAQNRAYKVLRFGERITFPSFN